MKNSWSKSPQKTDWETIAISASAEDTQKLGLTVEQKDNRLFLSGDAKVANELIQLLK